MKKLFFVTSILFLLFGFNVFGNAGNVCGVGIPPDVCFGKTGGNQAPVYVAPNYYGAIAVDIETGQWSSASAYPTRKSARETVISGCGEHCKVINVDVKRCVAIAYSETDKILESDSAIAVYGKIGYNTRVVRSNEKAIKKCEKSGGKNCKVLVNVCALEGTSSKSEYNPKIWGAIALDSELGKNGWSWSHETEIEAINAAEADCRRMGGKKCTAIITYGDKEYATYSVSKTDGSYGVARDLNESAADKRALEECSEYAKDCYIFMTVHAERGLIKPSKK
ncbi:MAG: DUF4189 domain-containing protein [Sebaldella sp.]|nr:DUF4189 domain-containing protein [Sebaldella sp.]